MAAPNVRDRRSDDQQTERRERRVGNAGPPPEGERRKLLQRMKQPLIGLGLAGMALPMVQATKAAPENTSATTDEEDASATDAARAAGDTEDNLAGQIASTREEAARDQAVMQAMDKYGISRDLAEDIYDVAVDEEIEPRLAYGLIKTESTFNERAQSHVGARGLTQVMPRTASWLLPGTKAEDLYNRQTNLRLGFRYLNQMIDKYDGDVRLALLAYNRGPGTVDKVLKQGGNPNNGYADKVLRG